MRVEYEPEPVGWSLRWGDLLLHLRLHNGTLLADFSARHHMQPPHALPGPEIFDALTVTRGDATLYLAPDSRQVSWALHDWTQPDASSLVLTLQALDLPLRANLLFVVDEQTGILRRKTDIEHTGSGQAVTITHAGTISVVLPLRRSGDCAYGRAVGR